MNKAPFPNRAYSNIELFFKHIINSVDGHYFVILDSEGVVIFASTISRDSDPLSVVKIGSNIKNHKGLSIFEIFINRGWKKHTAGRRVLRKKIVMERNRGRSSHFQTQLSAMFDSSNSVVGYMFVANDVTNSIETLRVLKESRDRLEKAQKIARIGNFELDIDSGETFWSSQIYKMLKISKLTKAGFDTLKSVMDSSFHSDFDISIKKALLDGKDHNVIFPITLPNGEKRWMNYLAYLNRSQFGKAEKLVGIIQDVTERKEHEEELYRMVHHDPLTNLPNRVLFNERFALSKETAKRFNKKLAILFLDLDHFKNINDTLGHSVGDKVIRHLADTLIGLIRSEDTIARVGGDEFIVILNNIETLYDVERVSAKIIQLFSTPLEVEEHVFNVGMSIGIAIYPDDGDSSEELVKNADTAMYEAKDDGRNRFKFYESKMTQMMVDRVKLDKEIHSAVENSEFIVYYQPQFDLQSGETIGMEALIRWESPNDGLVSPFIFIPRAEETGLIVPIGEMVLIDACRAAKKWQEEIGFFGLLAVNVSGVQIKYGAIIDQVKKALEVSGLDAKYLELEMTETYIMENAEHSIAILKELKELGVLLAIDDFGTGYSSLSYLKQFPVDKLKIDKAFVDGLPEDNDDKSISRAIIALSHSMDMTVLAEGIEKSEQIEFLNESGCDYGQGYHYARPLDCKVFEEFIKKKISEK